MLKKPVLVENVDEFPGHIVCDSRSRSEVVIPIIRKNQVIGVLDVDSASLSRFSTDDQAFFEQVVFEILKKNP